MISQDVKLHEVDVIILATGYETSYIPRFPIIGLNKVNLQDDQIFRLRRQESNFQKVQMLLKTTPPKAPTLRFPPESDYQAPME